MLQEAISLKTENKEYNWRHGSAVKSIDCSSGGTWISAPSSDLYGHQAHTRYKYIKAKYPYTFKKQIKKNGWEREGIGSGEGRKGNERNKGTMPWVIRVNEDT